MPKSKSQKQVIVDELVEKFTKMKSAAFVHFFGLKVKDIEDLRKRCRKEGIDYVVAKKTLLKVALAKAGVTGINPQDMEGEVGTAFSYADEVAAAKLLATFARDHAPLKFVGGILEGKLIDAKGMKHLASLPGKQELLGQLVGTIQAPVSAFVRVLSGNLRGLVQVLSALQESKS